MIEYEAYVGKYALYCRFINLTLKIGEMISILNFIYVTIEKTSGYWINQMIDI